MAVAAPPTPGREAEEHILDVLAQEMERAKSLSDVCYEKASGEYGSAGDIARYQEAAAAYRTAVEAYKRELARVEDRRRDLGEPHLRQRAREWQESLAHSYGSKGPQYMALCAVLAPMITRAEAAAEGGVRLTPDQHTDLGRTISAMISQLQKHTESTHTTSENISKGALMVMQIVERRLGTQPKVVQAIFQDAKDAVAQVSAVEARALGAGRGRGADVEGVV